MNYRVLIFFALTLLFGCGDQGTSYNGVFLGRFVLTAYDTLGNTMTHGTLVLHQNGAKIAGSWKFLNEESGDLEGSVEADQMMLNLNPGFVDNNLILQGRFSGNRYSGLWQKIGFPGVIAHGPFHALRQ